MKHIDYKEEAIIREMRRQRSKLDYPDIINRLEETDINAFERNFIDSIIEQGREDSMSPAQKKVIEKMYAKYLEKKKNDG
jgi:hypothetical protein